MIFSRINQIIAEQVGLELAIAEEVNTTVTYPHQNNASGVLSTILSAPLSGGLGTKAMPQRCADVL
jgi:type II secretory pathway component HofQ